MHLLHNKNIFSAPLPRFQFPALLKLKNSLMKALCIHNSGHRASSFLKIIFNVDGEIYHRGVNPDPDSSPAVAQRKMFLSIWSRFLHVLPHFSWPRMKHNFQPEFASVLVPNTKKNPNLIAVSVFCLICCAHFDR